MKVSTKSEWLSRASAICARDKMVRMGAVDRVMRAYEQKHKITEEQARIIRAEISKFIDELLGGEQFPLNRSEHGER